MDKDLAKHIATVAYKMQSPLQELLPVIKEHCSPQEYTSYLKATAKVMATINMEITNKIFAQYPEIETEFDRKIKKYGRIV